MENPNGGTGSLNVEYLFARLAELIQSIIAFFSGDGSALSGLIAFLKAVAALLVLLILGVIIYSIFGILRVREKEHAHLHHQMHEAQEHEGEDSENPRWNAVTHHINSENPSDWRLAVIEADLLMEEILDRAGFEGPTIGDKLRSASIGDFQTLPQAREAHGVRNQIAHQGSEFDLSHTAARRVIGLYEEVFTEFNQI